MPERVKRILTVLQRRYPEPKTALKHRNPLQLLVSTILSAQCTDARVNLVTPKLFRAYRSADALAKAPREKVEELIHSTGFYRSKAKAIQEACLQIATEHKGKVPSTMKELTELRGVGRKTANVVLGSGFGKAEGVVVDTHVGRLSRRLGLTKEKDPVKVERDLVKVIPKEEWTRFSHQLIYHGRETCRSIRPRCSECDLRKICPSAEPV